MLLVSFTTKLYSPKGMPLFHCNAQVGWVLRMLQWLINTQAHVVSLINCNYNSVSTRATQVVSMVPVS